jgi:predicted amino acid-binding ACT domain protein
VTERTWPQLVYIYIINEISPRLKKNKMEWSDINSDFVRGCFTLVALKEHNKMIDRKTARQMMDKMFEILSHENT